MDNQVLAQTNALALAKHQEFQTVADGYGYTIRFSEDELMYNNGVFTGIQVTACAVVDGADAWWLFSHSELCEVPAVPVVGGIQS